MKEMTDDQLERYEAFRRSRFPLPAIKHVRAVSVDCVRWVVKAAGFGACLTTTTWGWCSVQLLAQLMPTSSITDQILVAVEGASKMFVGDIIETGVWICAGWLLACVEKGQ